MTRITLFDYGAGNLHSLAKAFVGAAREVRVEPDPLRALETDLLVLPGVGAFGPAAARLAPGREAMRTAILSGLPTIGICLGMQLLFDGSDEGEGHGLGVIAGRVTRLDAVRRPQIGGNTLENVTDAAFALSGVEIAYYANGFACRPDDTRVVTAWSQHERDRFPAAVRVARTIGVQFHPEKSSAPGRCLLDQLVRELTASPAPAHGATSY